MSRARVLILSLGDGMRHAQLLVQDYAQCIPVVRCEVMHCPRQIASTAKKIWQTPVCGPAEYSIRILSAVALLSRQAYQGRHYPLALL